MTLRLAVASAVAVPEPKIKSNTYIMSCFMCRVMKVLMNIIYDIFAYQMSLEGEDDPRLELYDAWITYKISSNLYYALI